MTFPSINNFPPISVNNEFAIPAGTTGNPTVVVNPPENTPLGLTELTAALANPGSIFVTVTGENGQPLPIGALIVLLSKPAQSFANSNRLQGITINFSDAPISGKSLSLETMEARFPRAFDFFGRYFLATATPANAKVAVEGFTSFTEADANSNFNLSQGNDAVVMTTLNNVVYANAGSDAIVVDAYLSNPGTATKSYINLGTGNDDVQVTKAALKQNQSRIDIMDFNSAEDTLSLQTMEKRVDGIGTDKLKITTKEAKFVIKSIESGGIFEENSIDFI
ncbi:hypothetical protein H8F24_13495 [Synechococcus sp. CBW1002]|uniref:hypothetical protein n=1 Tax=Synechococcus sp. CBW1002 TaxID=1353134 RepID=UPI0018CD039E|nr:hypothetical protein [Synechococcus sp. CBW1002]QPN59091.1 hypothetical protein H8F24_13495 [Synechococcus sp. CBW1002]